MNDNIINRMIIKLFGLVCFMFLIQDRTGKKNIAYALIVLSIVSMTACGGLTTQKTMHTNIGEKNRFIHVIINDQAVISEKYGSKLINKIEEVFRKLYENVSVKTGYADPKSHEVLITPTELIFTWPRVMRCTSKSKIKVSYNNDFQHYIVEGQGEMDFGAYGDALGIVHAILIIPTAATVIMAHTALLTKNVSDQAMESTAMQLRSKVITSPRFKAYAESIEMLKTSPSSLAVKVKYIDKSSILPNSTIDAGELSIITSTITNKGKGTAFDVNFTIKSLYENISFSEEISISNIQPGEYKDITIPIKADLSLASNIASFRIKDILPGQSKKITIPVSANTNLSTGIASFKIKAKEKRGYGSRPVVLQIPTAKLQSPDLMFASSILNDSSGLAIGDGDSQPENNEVVEVNTYIKNEGVGDALKVKVQLSEVSEGLEIIKSEDDMAKINPSATKKFKLAFKIPRTYSQPEIKYTIIATDVRGIKTEKSYTIPFTAKSPKLKFAYKVIGQNNNEVPFLENGKSYRLMVIPENIGNNFAQNVSTSVQTMSRNVSIGNFNNDIGRIDPGIPGKIITVPIDLNRSFSKTSLDLIVAMVQDSFSGIEKKIILPVQLKQPKLQYKVTLLNGVTDNSISQNSSSNFRVSITNQGGMDAEDVKIRFKSMKDGVEIDEERIIGRIRSGGDNQYEDFVFFVRGNVETGNFPIKLIISQADLEPVISEFSYKIVKQTALVQTVKGTGQSISSGKLKNAYVEPPQFYINTPGNNIKTIKQQIDLHGSIITFGAGNATQDLTISLNGRTLSVLPVQEEQKLDPNIITKRETKDNKTIFDGSIILDPGKNSIKISGMDRNGLKNSEEIIVDKQTALGNIYAVVIGISEFLNHQYNLKYATDDARKFNNFLKSEYGGNLPDNHIKFLYNNQARRADIIAALTNFLGQTSKEDIVEIYMSTHGCIGKDGKLYYLCHDSDTGNLKGTAFSDEDFTEILSQDIKAGKVIMYLDTCHAGMSGLSKLFGKRDIDVININRQTNRLASEISRTKNGVAKFSASSANGFSLEDHTLNMGVFTHWLIKGLNGKANENNDEWVNASELEKYLRKNVTMATSGKQTPKATLTIDDNTPLAKVR